MNNRKTRKTKQVKDKLDDEGKSSSLNSHKRLIVNKTKEVKEARAVAIVLRIFGAMLMVGAVSIWYSKYSVVPMTGSALIGGILLAGIFKLVYPDGLDASNRVQKTFALSFSLIWMLLIVNQATAGYAIMLLFGLVSAVYLFGVVKTLPGLKP